MLTGYEIPNLQFSLPATTAIARYRFVSVNASGEAIQATATTPIVGVSRNIIDPVRFPDGQVLDIADGIMMVEAAGAITAGAQVICDAQGRAAAMTDPDTETAAGIALTDSTVAGTICAIKL